MASQSEFENRAGMVAGIYRQNALYMRMHSLCDFAPAEGEPPVIAVAMHAHEYVHFLHNVSTTAGQVYLLSNLILLRALAAGCDDQGHFRGVDEMTYEQRNWVNFAVTLMRAQQGSSDIKWVDASTTARVLECSSPIIDKRDGIETVTTVFSADNGDTQCRSEVVTVGLNLITEGVAYGVEREIRRLNGEAEYDLDDSTPVFPYLAYHDLVRCWSGRHVTVQESIAIGVTALTYPFAGVGLATVCLRLKESGLPLADILANARGSNRAVSEDVLVKLHEQRRDLSQGDIIWTAMGEYMKLAEKAVQLRRRRWDLELEFLKGPLTPADLQQRIIGSMLDCLVIQEKPEGLLDMYWVGPGHIAEREKSMQALGALQSALHFSQLHLMANGAVVATTMLEQRLVTCPFVGGCQAESLAWPKGACQSAPWKCFTPSLPGDAVCWYAAGVKALRQLQAAYS